VAAIGERMRAAGIDVVGGVGTELARIPLVARHPVRKDRLVLAIETDGPAYAARPTVRDRDRLGPDHLTRLGWAVHRVWSTAWIDDPDRETERLVETYEKAVTVADAYDWALAAAQADDVVGMPEEGTTAEQAPDQAEPAGDESSEPRDAGQRTPAPERGPRPRVSPGRAVGAYTRQELAAVARWVESDGRARTEAEAIAEIAFHLGLPDRAPRAEDSLRHAVRVARAGAPPLWSQVGAEPTPNAVNSQPARVD
jgi:hypothetical protein